MAAHADDLRAEVAGQGETGLELVRAVREDYRTARLAPADRKMLDFAVKLTRTPSAMTQEDIEDLRGAGFDDAAIHEIVQVTGFFNMYNRIADGLGIEMEDPHPPTPSPNRTPGPPGEGETLTPRPPLPRRPSTPSPGEGEI